MRHLIKFESYSQRSEVKGSQLRRVKINGFEYYADINKRILYETDKEENGNSFDKLTPSEKDQLYNFINYEK